MSSNYINGDQLKEILTSGFSDVKGYIDNNSGGSSVIANPTLSGDEAALNGLEVDGVKYAVGGGSGGGTTVVANPELSGTENNLTGLQVGDTKYTVPKGAKHYVVNKLPTTDIDTTGNYYVMTESADGRSFLSTDISNLTTTEYQSSNTGALRQDATVNSSDWVRLNATQVSGGDYFGDIAIKFNIPCTVTLSVNPRQTRLAFMYIDVNGVNVKLVNAGETYTYTRVFGVNETLCVRGASFSTNQFYYKLSIQPYTIDGKMPISTNVDEYINYDNIWFKNGGGSNVVANPTLSGDEATINGLEVDGVKYAVGGGSGGGGTTNLYLHSIHIYKENSCSINFSFINSTSTEYDENKLFSLLRGSSIPCSGIVIDNGFKNVLNCEFSQIFKINVYYFATAGRTITSPYQFSGKYKIEDTVKQVM